ncbi:hypothetical protein [Streptomyces sp. NPDC056244]|uniref:hypothetical protein n=1 Tax=Streptomyces sp. NPDC056244 TaxID=3345762 RepID=UPI0035DE40B2
MPVQRPGRPAGCVDRELSGLGDGERLQVVEERLREQAAIEIDVRQAGVAQFDPTMHPPHRTPPRPGPG